MCWLWFAVSAWSRALAAWQAARRTCTLSARFSSNGLQGVPGAGGRDSHLSPVLTEAVRQDVSQLRAPCQWACHAADAAELGSHEVATFSDKAIGMVQAAKDKLAQVR